ncbi:flagellar motor switch protein FliM [Methylopila jiangsuensis]|uniref:Flagellar motor switch protein FliM n=1 Tax=Methylopila jiangsuensis TaxID=586230 RepID=A0A9W6JJW2_9HYPH|nr:flagellar motor switch protein FliM [Methylopila jiangsuensis]MDR6284873.1 flagellar motor switch protein FliM [Methylopila jiangsuensis]GLK77736.1 flagellar motor switch protein FliM [Methylopila jiangsuensis]
MAGPDDDFDDLAAEWGAAMAEQVGEAEGDAADWAAKLADTSDVADRKAADRVLTQDEVDGLLGFNPDELGLSEQSGIRAIINSALVSYERLPMLEIVFDRLVRLLTTSLRNFTSDNVEVSLDGIKSVRFGDYLNSIPLPAILSVFRAEQWDGFGLMTVDSALTYSIIDVLLGGRRGVTTMKVEGRPYTTIETSLVQRMIEVVLADAEHAFRPISEIHFSLDRLETNPRFAAITRSANAAILVNLRIDMEDRGGRIEMLIPYATLEPIRDVLLQQFMGEKFGRDATWEGHLATEIWQAKADVHAVLYEKRLPLREIMNLDVGDTLMLDVKPDDLVELRCGDQVLTEGRMGRAGEHVAVQVMRPLRRSNTTLAAFEAAGQVRKEAS